MKTNYNSSSASKEIEAYNKNLIKHIPKSELEYAFKIKPGYDYNTYCLSKNIKKVETKFNESTRYKKLNKKVHTSPKNLIQKILFSLVLIKSFKAFAIQNNPISFPNNVIYL